MKDRRNKKSSFRPLNARMIRKNVLIERMDIENVTKGGIVLAEVSVRKTNVGKVVSVGPEVTEVFVGNVVWFGQYAGAEKVVIDNKEFCVITEDDVIAVNV